MKPLITLLLISFWINCNGQEDSLTSQRFLVTDAGITFIVHYKYAQRIFIPEKDVATDAVNDTVLHEHHIALCSIEWFRGNQKKIIAENIKAIYSPVECSADSPKLWLKRLYDIQNKKK